MVVMVLHRWQQCAFSHLGQHFLYWSRAGYLLAHFSIAHRIRLHHGEGGDWRRSTLTEKSTEDDAGQGEEYRVMRRWLAGWQILAMRSLSCPFVVPLRGGLLVLNTRVCILPEYTVFIRLRGGKKLTELQYVCMNQWKRCSIAQPQHICVTEWQLRHILLEEMWECFPFVELQFVGRGDECILELSLHLVLQTCCWVYSELLLSVMLLLGLENGF